VKLMHMKYYYTKFTIKPLLKTSDKRCIYCGSEIDLDKEHIVPKHWVTATWP
jgi:hypothetical protein